MEGAIHRHEVGQQIQDFGVVSLYRLRIVSPEGDFAQGGHGLQQ